MHGRYDAGRTANVTCTTLRPRRSHGRRSGPRDRFLRGAGPRGRGQDVPRGRVLGHGLRHSRLPDRNRHAEAAPRWHPPGPLGLLPTHPGPGPPGRNGHRPGIRNVALEGKGPAAAGGWAATEGYGLVGGMGEYEGVWRMAYVRGPEGIVVALAERIG